MNISKKNYSDHYHDPMNYTDLNYCLTVLRQRPRWFKKDDIQAKLDCLDAIQTSEDIYLIHFLIEFLRSHQPLVRQKTAEIIVYFFGKLKSHNAHEQSLKHLQIDIADFLFFRDNFDVKTNLYLLQIASFNHSGYVRQKAVELLAGQKDAEAIKFILFRLGDWVPQVSAAAEIALQSFINSIYLDGLLAQLPVIESLLKVRRINLTAIHKRISDFIVGETDFNTIRKHPDNIRLLYYKHLLLQPSINKEQAIQILQDRYFLVRLELLKQISKFDNSFQKVLITASLDDRSTSVRISALRATQTHVSTFDVKIDQSLSDKSAAVRELCRYLLKPAGKNYAELYRTRIANKVLLTGSIGGLSETGGSWDIPIFEHYIHSENSNLVTGCLAAIHKFDPDKAKTYALQLITHPVKKIRDKSFDVLVKGYDASILGKIRSIYAAGNDETKQHILRCYSKIGGWDIISDLLIALSDENVAIREFAWAMLDKWEASSVRIFTKPPLTTIQSINQLLNNLNTDIQTMTSRKTEILKNLLFTFR